MGRPHVEVCALARQRLQELIGEVVAVELVGVVLYHARAHRHELIGVLMYSGGFMGKEVAQVFPAHLSAFLVLLYPVGLVHKVDAPQIGIVAVALHKGYDILVYIGLYARFGLHHRTPVLRSLIAILEMVEGQERGHEVYLMLCGDLEQLVKVCPVLLAHGCDYAVGIELDYAHAVAVDPHAGCVHALLVQHCEVLIPEALVECAAEVVPLVPGGVHAVYPYLFAVHGEPGAVNTHDRAVVVDGCEYGCLGRGFGHALGCDRRRSFGCGHGWRLGRGGSRAAGGKEKCGKDRDCAFHVHHLIIGSGTARQVPCRQDPLRGICRIRKRHRWEGCRPSEERASPYLYSIRRHAHRRGTGGYGRL